MEQLESRKMLTFTHSFDPSTGILAFTGTSEVDTLQLLIQDATGSKVTYNLGTVVSKLDPPPPSIFTQSGVKGIVVLDPFFTDLPLLPNADSLEVIGFGGITLAMQGTNYTFGGGLGIQTLNIESVSLNSGSIRGNVLLDGPAPLTALSVSNADIVTVGATAPVRVGALTIAANTVDLKSQVVAGALASLKTATGSVTLNVVSPLTITAPITASTTSGTITINSRNGVLQTATSPLTAQNLVVENVVSGDVRLATARNAITNLEIQNRADAGAVIFTNADSLTIGNVVAGVASAGIVSNDATVSVMSGGTLSLSAPVDAGEGTVSLSARNGITSVAAGGIIGTTLTVSNGLVAGAAAASGDIGLDVSAVNRIDVIAAYNAPTAGSVRFKNTTGLGVGVGTVNINGVSTNVTGVTTNAGSISLASSAGAVAVVAAINATNGGAVNLAATEGITQSGSGTISALNLTATNTGVAGGIALELAGNEVGFVSGRNTAGNGSFLYRDANAVSVGNGGIVVDAASGSVRLTAGGQISQLAPVVAYALRAVNENTAAGSITLQSASNDVDVFESQNQFTGGSVVFTNKAPLAIGDFGIDAEGNAVTLTVAGGLTQTGGITAGSLNLRRTADGDIDLDDASNDILSLTATVNRTAGRLNFADSSGFSIGRLTASNVGVQAAGVDVSLRAGAAGDITQTGSVTAANLRIGSDTGNVLLTLPANEVTTLSGESNTGTISYRDATGVAIGIDGLSTAGTMILTVSGALTQQGAVTAADLRATNLTTAGGAISFDLADNDVVTFAAANASVAAIVFRDATNFTIGASGINGRGGISLTSGGDLLQDSSSGGIVGQSLSLTNLNEAAGNILLTAASNNVVSLTAVNEAREGDLSFTDVGGLSIGVAEAGITTNLGDVSIVTSGPLSLAASVNAGQNDVTPSSVSFSASGGITQSAGSVVTNALSLFNATSGAISLPQQTNDVDQLAASTLGNITFVDADSFSTGVNRSGTLGVEVTTKGSLNLTALTGTMRVVSGLAYGTAAGRPQLFLTVGPAANPGTLELVPTSTEDNPLAGAAFSGTLRDMLRYANNNQVRATVGGVSVVQPQTVVFDELGYAVDTITLAAVLPGITQTLAFDGTRVEDTLADRRVGIDGSAVTSVGANGLLFSGGSAGSSVNGMAIHGFAKAAGVQFQVANGLVTQSYLGLTRTGEAAGNLYGIDLPTRAATGITIGGNPLDLGVLDPDVANILAANTVAGVMVRGGAAGNTIIGNYVGTNTAEEDLGNGSGIVINATANTTVTGNIVGRNVANGILLDSARATAATQNRILSNTIVDNGLRLPAGAGVRVTASAFAQIGAVGEGNIIGRNTIGILVDKASTSITIAGNSIGTNLVGEDLGNLADGVRISASIGNTVGGLTPDLGNVVAFNGDAGIRVENAAATSLAAGNRVLSNVVRDNAGDGIVINGGSRTTIGDVNAGNVITGNSGDGIKVALFGRFGSTANAIRSNLIGTDSPTADTALGNVGRGIAILAGSGHVVDRANVVRFNADSGIHVEGSGSNVIGSATPGQGNIVSDNGGSGIVITDGAGRLPTQNNSVSGNTIANNVGNGVTVGGSGVINTTIGTGSVNGRAVGSPNTILGNDGYGVNVAGGATKVQTQANSISDSGLGGIFIAPGSNGGVVPPTISSAVIVRPLTGGPQVLVRGTARGVARQSVAIDVYATPFDPNATRTVGGQIYLGRINVVIGAGGSTAFSSTLNLGIAQLDDLITATATISTPPVGSTSAFSAATVAITAGTVASVSPSSTRRR